MREIEGVDRSEFIAILFMDTENFNFLYNTSLLLITTQESLGSCYRDEIFFAEE